MLITNLQFSWNKINRNHELNNDIYHPQKVKTSTVDEQKYILLKESSMIQESNNYFKDIFYDFQLQIIHKCVHLKKISDRRRKSIWISNNNSIFTGVCNWNIFVGLWNFFQFRYYSRIVALSAHACCSLGFESF